MKKELPISHDVDVAFLSTFSLSSFSSPLERLSSSRTRVVEEGGSCAEEAAVVLR